VKIIIVQFIRKRSFHFIFTLQTNAQGEDSLEAAMQAFAALPPGPHLN
jgi:hypothetical protein